MKKVQTQKKVHLYLLKNPKASLKKINKDLDINTAGYHAAALRKEGTLPAAPFGKVGKHKKKVESYSPVFTAPLSNSTTKTMFMVQTETTPKHPIDIPTKLSEKPVEALKAEKFKIPFLCKVGMHIWECYPLKFHREGQGRMCVKCNLQEERYRYVKTI